MITVAPWWNERRPEDGFSSVMPFFRHAEFFSGKNDIFY